MRNRFKAWVVSVHWLSWLSVLMAGLLVGGAGWFSIQCFEVNAVQVEELQRIRDACREVCSPHPGEPWQGQCVCDDTKTVKPLESE